MGTITKEMIADYEKYLGTEEKSVSTIEKYVRDIRRFAVEYDGEDITKSIVLQYKGSLSESYRVSSVNSIISSLNSFFGFIGWHDLRLKNIKVQRQLFLPDEKSLSKTEYERLLFAAQSFGGKRLNLVMQCICSTGIRVSELKYITVEALRIGKAEISNKGKRRVIFIPSKLCRVLLKYAKEQKISIGSVFVTRTGKPLDRSNLWSDMKRLCDAAGVPKAKVFPHNLRHLFARTYYSSQKDIVRLADILGHSSVNTTRIYTMETGEVHKKQIEKLGLFFV